MYDYRVTNKKKGSMLIFCSVVLVVIMSATMIFLEKIRALELLSIYALERECAYRVAEAYVWHYYNYGATEKHTETTVVYQAAYTVAAEHSYQEGGITHVVITMMREGGMPCLVLHVRLKRNANDTDDILSWFVS